ncbi:MAG: tyrosine-protein phosphatase [Porticoccaceae bacterium]|jgi:protein-tyrosine phosphatase|nr:tyrosine-protein phosphatase [Porticoccaceae bacterium]MBT5578096.1 tyrosine-protein phosphatase [Porticoccaceae bacterium]MBT7375625.1 tyrosine-protein phosphatase [Porticoccaceae bacterium]
MVAIETESRLVPLDGGINFRDIGGYVNSQGRRVKWRKIMRCGHLANLTQGDLDVLEEIGVSQIHDFRRVEEQAQNPSCAVRAEFIDDYQMSIGDISRFWEFLFEGELSAESSHQLVVNSYRNCIQAVIPAFTRFMRHIVDNADNASVFHCSAGKDRTGMAAALILSALDVPRDTIVADYMLTIEHYDSTRLIEIVEGHLRDAKVESWERSWLIPYCSVHQDNIVAFLEAIDAEYGDVRNYLTSALGLSDQDLIKIQESYLQD